MKRDLGRKWLLETTDSVMTFKFYSDPKTDCMSGVTRRTSNCQVGPPTVLSIDLSSYGLSVTQCHTLSNICLARRSVRCAEALPTFKTFPCTSVYYLNVLKSFFKVET